MQSTEKIELKQEQISDLRKRIKERRLQDSDYDLFFNLINMVLTLRQAVVNQRLSHLIYSATL